MSPKFSIIIPVFNVAPYLRECLDSVLAQTYTDWEAICVDDGSTDGSGEILDKYAAHDSRFHVIHQANTGVSAARNAALDVARGSYIWCIDGDDLILQYALDFLKNVLHKYGEADCLTVKNLKGETFGLSKADVDYNISVYDNKCSESARLFNTAVWRVVFRRESLGEHRFKHFTHNEDALFTMTFYWLKCARHIATDANLYFYRQRLDSAMHRKFTLTDIANVFETESLMLDAMESMANANLSNVAEFYKEFQNRLWISWFGKFFDLDVFSRHKLLPRWIKIQERMNKLSPLGRRQLFKLQLINITKSAILAKRLVTGRWI